MVDKGIIIVAMVTPGANPAVVSIKEENFLLPSRMLEIERCVKGRDEYCFYFYPMLLFLLTVAIVSHVSLQSSEGYWSRKQLRQSM